MSYFFFFFFNDTATTEIYTLSLHDALPICERPRGDSAPGEPSGKGQGVEKGPGEFEFEVVGVQIGVAQRHQPGVRDAQGGDAAGDRAPRELQGQPIYSHLPDPDPL